MCRRASAASLRACHGRGVLDSNRQTGADDIAGALPWLSSGDGGLITRQATGASADRWIW